MKIIKVTRITEINLFRLSTKEIGNLYVEDSGKIFKSRRNHSTKRIEVVKIDQIEQSEIDSYIVRESAKIVPEDESPPIAELEPAQTPVNEPSTNTDSAVSDKIEKSSDFIDTTGERITKENIPDVFNKIVTRLKIIEKSLVETDIFNPSVNSRYNDFIDRVRKYFNYLIPEKNKETFAIYKELRDYPRAIGHYFMKYSGELVTKIKAQASDEPGQLSIVRNIEMEKIYRELTGYISEEVNNVYEYIKNVEPSEVKSMTSKSQQAFDDALITTKTVLSQLNKVLLMLKTLEFK